jgi:hypothetical protein
LKAVGDKSVSQLLVAPTRYESHPLTKYFNNTLRSLIEHRIFNWLKINILTKPSASFPLSAITEKDFAAFFVHSFYDYSIRNQKLILWIFTGYTTFPTGNFFSFAFQFS